MTLCCAKTEPVGFGLLFCKMGEAVLGLKECYDHTKDSIQHRKISIQSLAINNIPGSSYPFWMIQILGVLNFRDFNWDTSHSWTILRKTCLSSQILTIKMHIKYSKVQGSRPSRHHQLWAGNRALHLAIFHHVSALTSLYCCVKCPTFFVCC